MRIVCRAGGRCISESSSGNVHIKKAASHRDKKMYAMMGIHWKRLTGLALLASVLICSACSMLGGNTRKDALAQTSWAFANDAVIIETRAEPSLNQYAGEAHTLLLGIYQMSDAESFRQLTADPAALAAAMASGRAGDAFLQFSRYVVTPGQCSMLVLDRAQKAKFVGVTAGYYQMSATGSARLLEVPLITTSKGWFINTYTTAPGPLVVRMNFGAEAILDSEAISTVPGKDQLQKAVVLEGGGKEIKLNADDLNCTAESYKTLNKLGN